MTHGTAFAVLTDGRHLNLSTQGYEDFRQFAETVRVLFGPQRFQVARFWYAWESEAQEYTPAEMREAFGMQ